MCYRKGNYIYAKFHSQCSMQHASDFPARLIGSVAIGAIIMIVIFTIALTPLAMKEFYRFIAQFRFIILALFLPWGLQAVSSKLFIRFAFSKKTIKSRTYWQ